MTHVTSDESAEDIRQDEESAGFSTELYHPNVYDFFTDRLAYLVPLPPAESGLAWCAEWFRHAQALSRLDAVWRAWEHLRLEPALGIANWWTHYVDPHMRALMDPVAGPFARCRNGHENSEPLPSAPAPEGLFSDQRQILPLADDPLELG
jgi:hypothetical protein